MTPPPERLGDWGYRFAVEIEGYPKEGWQEIGYADEKDSAVRLATTLLKAPGAKNCRIIDRNQ